MGESGNILRQPAHKGSEAWAVYVWKERGCRLRKGLQTGRAPHRQEVFAQIHKGYTRQGQTQLGWRRDSHGVLRALDVRIRSRESCLPRLAQGFLGWGVNEEAVCTGTIKKAARFVI